ncbi:MAG: CoA ester lyase, partial [Halobacteriales archaeon]|nr:CoA ester lyase [Halobacteriales archaeon]
MVRRSVLFSPGNRPEMMRKAPGTGADVCIFDLEDAVPPSGKAAARDAVAEVLTDPEFDPTAEICVRVNPAGVAADDDLRVLAPALMAGTIDSVMLPKVNAPEEVRTLRRLMEEHGSRVPVIALVETASGILAAPDIAAASGTDALAFGAEDLSADIGATRTESGTEVLYAREHTVLSARAAGVDVIDTLFTDIGDLDGLSADAAFAAQLGFDGKIAVHPAQVPPINEAFTPDDEAIEWAQRVLEARDEAETAGRGVFRV